MNFYAGQKRQRERERDRNTYRLNRRDSLDVFALTQNIVTSWLNCCRSTRGLFRSYFGRQTKILLSNHDVQYA